MRKKSMRCFEKVCTRVRTRGSIEMGNATQPIGKSYAEIERSEFHPSSRLLKSALLMRTLPSVDTAHKRPPSPSHTCTAPVNSSVHRITPYLHMHAKHKTFVKGGLKHRPSYEKKNTFPADFCNAPFLISPHHTVVTINNVPPLL